MISPVIPDRWRGFVATRIFRGVHYDINVKRQGKGNRVTLTVDGKPIEGAVVPLPPDGTREVKVEVRLG
jgi:cellobiose phosphorylase